MGFALLPSAVTFRFRHNCSASNCPVGEPLADHAAQEDFRALEIFYPVRLAIVVPEIKFRFLETAKKMQADETGEAFAKALDVLAPKPKGKG